MINCMAFDLCHRNEFQMEENVGERKMQPHIYRHNFSRNVSMQQRNLFVPFNYVLIIPEQCNQHTHTRNGLKWKKNNEKNRNATKNIFTSFMKFLTKFEVFHENRIFGVCVFGLLKDRRDRLLSNSISTSWLSISNCLPSPQPITKVIESRA